MDTFDKESMKTMLKSPLINKQERTPPAIKAHGILGFVRFLKGFYIILITARKKVAKIGLHTIYTILETKMVPLFSAVASSLDIDEKKYLQIFKTSSSSMDLYFSYTYDLTRSL